MRTTLKTLVLQQYISNPLKDPYEISLEVGGKYAWVKNIIENYKLETSLKLPLYLVKSIDLLNTYYLFTETEEKMLSVTNGEINDITNLTEYELTWLNINKGWV